MGGRSLLDLDLLQRLERIRKGDIHVALWLQCARLLLSLHGVICLQLLARIGRSLFVVRLHVEHEREREPVVYLDALPGPLVVLVLVERQH